MENVGLNESEAAIEHESPLGHTDQPVLTDVAFEPGMFDTPGMAASVIGAVVALVVLFVFASTFSVLTKPIALAIAAAPVAVVFVVFLAATRRSGLRKVREIVADSTDSNLESRIKKLIAITRSLYTQTLTKEVAKALAAEGRGTSTIRIAPQRLMTPIDPIAVPFEPRRFDELAEAHAAGTQETEPHSGSTDESVRTRTASPPTVPRGIRRNFILKGGWILLAIIGLNWVFLAIEAIERRTVTAHFMVMTFALLAFILIPVEPGWFGGRQWLAVPGGIVVRKGAWLRKRLTLHLFDRRDSVLLLYRHFRRQWVLVVADRNACEAMMGTRQELESAIHAWLSPLPPPPVEQLSDLL